MEYFHYTYSSNLDSNSLSKAGNISKQAPIERDCSSLAASFTLKKNNKILHVSSGQVQVYW